MNLSNFLNITCNRLLSQYRKFMCYCVYLHNNIITGHLTAHNQSFNRLLLQTLNSTGTVARWFTHRYLDFTCQMIICYLLNYTFKLSLRTGPPCPVIIPYQGWSGALHYILPYLYFNLRSCRLFNLIKPFFKNFNDILWYSGCMYNFSNCEMISVLFIL